MVESELQLLTLISVITPNSKMTSKLFRMVALDLDGTLLAPNHQITSASVEYLRNLYSKGFLVIIATGRTISSSTEVIRKLNLPNNFTHVDDIDNLKDMSKQCIMGLPLVCLNGARGMMVKFDRCSSNLIFDELFHTPLSGATARRVINLARRMNLVTNYYHDRQIFAQPITELHYQFCSNYTKLTGTPITYISDNYEDVLTKGFPSKLLVFCHEDNIDTICTSFSKELEGEAHVIRGSPPWFVEILNKDVCKGRGLEKMCQALGVSLDETIAFGDGDNDIEFLQMAGRGIAMKNASDGVKKVADQVTKWTNAEDGVIKTLQVMEMDGILHFPVESGAE